MSASAWPERFKDRFVRETAKRVRFLLAASARYAEPARFVEALRRELGAVEPRDPAPEGPRA
jgi:hypothetical protein